MPGCIVSPTTASFKLVEKRRLRATPVITSTLEKVSDIGAARSIAATYGFANGTASTTVVVNNPPATTNGLPDCSSPFAGFNCYVEVIVTQPQTALLSAVFMSTGPTIQARAVALANTTATADGCVVALGEAAHAIDISTVGSPAMTLNDCAIYDNSPDSPGALTLSGSAT